MPTADRNLLFGVLALQSNFVSREALVAALHQWVANKSRDLGELLCEQGGLTRKQSQLLSELVAEFIHQVGSAEKCLQQISSITLVRDDLSTISDLEVQTSLSHLSPPPVTPAKVGNTTIAPAMAFTSESKSVGGQSTAGTRFRLLRPHAEGGLGVVSVAHDGELNREVAFKEIKRTYADNKESRNRFLLEAEITGGLEHPGIVPVYGLGQHADGRPYYAMRFIRGDSLKQALDEYHATATQLPDSERNLRLRRLLQRFISVCESIHYAHARGVLHRDLKPGNIMLGKYGETLVVDWGLARTATRDTNEPVAKSSTEETLLLPRYDAAPTQMGQVVGTPQYMSPEQATGQLDLLGPATDIYSLGATFYSILTGKPPVTGQKPIAILEAVKEGQITLPRQINPSIPRPLEAICLRALALRPEDRYATARELADDVEQWLADEPVTAYREPIGARVRRALRKRPMITGSIMATLLVGIVAFGIGYRMLGQKNHELLTERNRLRTAMDFLVSAFRHPDPEFSGRDVKAADVLLAGAEEAKNTLGKEPLLQAELLNAIAQTLYGLGLAKEALPLVESATRTRQQLLGTEHPATLQSLNNLALDLHSLGDLERASQLQRETLQKCLDQLGPNHSVTLTSMNNMAIIYDSTGQLDKALPLFAETLQKNQAIFGDNHPETLLSMMNLAHAYEAAGQLDKALPLFERTVKLMQAQRGPDHQQTLNALNGLGVAYQSAGKPEQAIPLHEEILQKSEAKLGPDHPTTLLAMNALARAYQSNGQLDKALPIFEETLQRRQAKHGSDHPNILNSMNNLALAYHAAGQIEKALAMFQETLEKRETKLGLDHPDTLNSRNNLATVYHSTGQLTEALKLLETALQKMQDKLGADHPETLTAMTNLASTYEAAGQLDKALSLHEQTVQKMHDKYGPDHPDTLSAMSNLAYTYLALGRFDEAISLLEQTLRKRQDKLGLDHPDTLSSLGGLASAYESAGALEKALPLHEEALQKRRAKLGPNHPDTIKEMNNLALAYLNANQLDKALPLHAETLEKARAVLGPDHLGTLQSMNNLAGAYRKSGQLDKALSLYEETLQSRRSSLGADHPHTLQSMNNLAGAYEAAGRLKQALALNEETLQLLRGKLGNDHLTTLTSMNNLAYTYRADGQLEKAVLLFAEARRGRELKLGPDHRATLNSITSLADAYRELGEPNKALPLYELAVSRNENKFGPEHPETLDSKLNLMIGYFAINQPDKAAPLWSEYLTFHRNLLEPQDFAELLAGTGSHLLKAKIWPQAEDALREALAIREQLTPDDWITFHTQALLGGALAGRGAGELADDKTAAEKLLGDAERLLIAGFQGMVLQIKNIPAKDQSWLSDAAQRLVDLYTAWDKPLEAEKWRQELMKLTPAEIK